MKAVIMAAGKSTRTYPLTLTRPKPLLPVLGKSILAWQIEALAPLVDGVVIVVGYRQEMIREQFGKEYRGVPISYVEQLEQRGTGHAVLQCAAHVDGPFLVQNGFLQRTPRGRVATALAYRHFGYTVPRPGSDEQPSLL